jgi:hypothetical protein
MSNLRNWHWWHNLVLMQRLSIDVLCWCRVLCTILLSAAACLPQKRAMPDVCLGSDASLPANRTIFPVYQSHFVVL